MEGFWTVQFSGLQGWGAGVITLIHGQVFGGDSGFMYTGTYTQEGNILNAHVHVKPHTTGVTLPVSNVMGRDEFDLDLKGTMDGNRIMATGNIPGTPLQLNGILSRRGTIPHN